MGFKDDNYATPTHRGHNPYLQEALNKLSDMKKEICECKRDYKSPLSGICELCWDEKYPDEETPEEAKKYAELSYYGDEVDAFVRGVKWQAERSYSEEEVKAIANKVRETGLTVEYLLLTEQFKKK